MKIKLIKSIFVKGTPKKIGDVVEVNKEESREYENRGWGKIIKTKEDSKNKGSNND